MTLSMMIDAAARDGVRLRGLGGTWSLSNCAATDGYLVNTKPLRMRSRLPETMVSTAYRGSFRDLLLVQCGASIQKLNDDLRAMGRSLKTSGASNGQTIVGAMSTGTHGSRYAFGAIQEYCVALHIAVGGGRHIWLERASYPVTSSLFISRIGATLVRDDAIFNAALVSFGSMGFIHAVVIESEPLYLLEMSRFRVPIDNALRHTLTTLDLAALPLPHPGEAPLHFEALVNAHDIDGGAYITTMYRRPGDTPYTPPSNAAPAFGPGDDILGAIGAVADLLPGPVPGIINTLAKQFYKTTERPVWGTHGEIFSGTDVRHGATSTEIGVALENTAAALEVTLAAQRAAGPFAGFIAMRFVRGSDATLAFTRFPMTCTIELPGADTRDTRRFFDATFDGLERAGIPHTLHWGQVGNYSPQKVVQMYGQGRVDSWKNARAFLLDAPAREVFANDFVRMCGLG
jgi:FAD/FMN-containing dehydrogenase